jgi:hypothetical protein
MDNRKELVSSYRRRTQRGGVYTITNTASGRFLLEHDTDIASARNRFNFMVSTGSCVPYELEKDWKEFGGKAFAFAVLEELEKKDGQSQEEFEGDLKALEQLGRDRLDSSKEYK